MTPDQISTLIDAGLVLASVVFPALSAKFYLIKKTKDELLQVIEEHANSNMSFERQAQKRGQKLAQKALKTLTNEEL